MSKKKGFSILETIIPMVRLLPPARWRAWRLGWYFNSSIALTTRARVDVFTTLALLSTRETVAVETLARRATCSRFMSLTLYKKTSKPLPAKKGRESDYIAIQGHKAECQARPGSRRGSASKAVPRAQGHMRRLPNRPHESARASRPDTDRR